MSHLPHRPIRITIDFDENLKNSIEKMAEKRNFSFSYMTFVLLQQAVKEKLRKSQSARQNNS